MGYLVSGTNTKQLHSALQEFLGPGQRGELILGVPNPMGGDQLATLQAYLQSKGFMATVDFGSTSDWSNAVRINFKRPSRSEYAFLPLALPPAALIIAALGVVGVTGILGFKLGNVLDSLSRNLVPIAVIAAGAMVLIATVKR